LRQAPFDNENGNFWWVCGEPRNRMGWQSKAGSGKLWQFQSVILLEYKK